MSEARNWQDWIREDISGVTPLGSYAAKRCPVRTQLDVLQPVEPAPVSPFLSMLGTRGDLFEVDIVDRLGEAFGDLRVLAGSREERAEETLEAMHRGDRAMAGGRLPVDATGRRVGEPDVLLRVGDAPIDGRWRYVPVDVKSHRMLTQADAGTDVVVQPLSDLEAPGRGALTTRAGRSDATGRDDTLQLAHYHRMLDACGHAPEGEVWAAIIGSEGAAVWYRLDRPRWSTPTSDPDLRATLRSALAVYDFEFGFRLDIAAVAMLSKIDSSVPLLVEPVMCSECGECPWRRQCIPQLEDRGDVSLLPGAGYSTWRPLRDAGLATIEQLAALDLPRAVDGVSTGKLEELCLQARARLSPAPVTPRHEPPRPVPGADVEVDVDMENDVDGAYLWGAFVTQRRGTALVEPGYHAFASWEQPFTELERADVFRRFWTWLQDLRRQCDEEGLSFMAYCWSAAAENRYLRDGAALIGTETEVERFIESRDWTDLLHWFKHTYASGHGNGLKSVAELLGFQWRDDDPGGAASMTWREDAIDLSQAPEHRAAAQARILAYNEDDVRATLAVRDVLRELQK